MRIIFIRHGEADYKNDCLTGIGRKQAELTAERLCDEGVEEIISWKGSITDWMISERK